ncbi:MAG: bifunctional 5,10-methylene-tetrahydrofolate dehydrogenase/5,10-methylene-tetrahydrofolate cyclohydrolase [Candidatus Cloacimonetes bacterium]|nr:bifunctional 5,10-methylene-tetrahydrofolate dehydrogenase/5,10-methylene-tetrahydrofolate cyclohydrolase [Candidatus Cloacimonadota bacterium]
MTTKILSAKPVIKQIYSSIRTGIAESGIVPKLVIIVIGEDPAAEYYVQNLVKKGKKNNIIVETINYDHGIEEKTVVGKIVELNSDNSIHGIMIQKPLPEQIDEFVINKTIAPEKDMDAFNPVNLGKLLLGISGFVPCTPAAVLEMISFYDIEVSGKNVVIIGRSNIVGKPLANLLLRKSKPGNATVTVCHSRTANLAKISSQADVLIAAIGKPFFVKPEMVKENALIIDVGVNRVFDDEKGYKYVGDVDYDACFEKVSAITPVPGGVGSVTTAMLLRNVFLSCKNTSS